MCDGIGAEGRALRAWSWLLLLAVLAGVLAVGLSDAGTTAAWAFQENAGGAAPADAGGGEVRSQSFLSWMFSALGWVWSIVFLLVSFVLVALILMNVLQVRRDNMIPQDFIEQFEEKLTNKDYQGAYDSAKNDESFVARVLASGLSKLNRGYEEAIEGMQEVGEDENMQLEHRLSYLALIGSLAPMLGLMGTVQGMIASFDKIATSPTSPKPSELAAGISTALFTTLVGLAIAIPAMISYGILRNRVARFVLEVGMVSEGLMSRFSTVGRPQPPRGGAAPAAAPASPQQ